MDSLTLRKLTTEDLEYFWVWGSDERVTKSLFWDAYKSRESALEFLSTVVAKHPWFKAIVVNGRPVGAITLDKRVGAGQARAELGYVLGYDDWNRGYATMAVKKALEVGFSDLGVYRIEALVDPANKGSMRVLEKAGFQKEGLLKSYLIHRGEVRDRYIYAVTK